MESIRSERIGQKPTKDRTLENKTRVFINGERLRVGNPKHPYYQLYKDKGLEAVLDAMGIVPTRQLAKAYGRVVEDLYSATRQGYVYIVWNKAWPEWVKVGMAVDAEDRLKTFNTGCPFRDYTVVKTYYTEDRFAAEQEAHDLLTLLADDRKGEWFKINFKEATALLNTIL